MKLYNILAATALICSSCASSEPVDATVNQEGEIVEGSITCDGKAVEDVLVTDGYNFVKSDKRGKFLLTLTDKAKFVSIVTPSGYVADFSDGVPNFYLEVEDDLESYDFELQEWGQKESYSLITIGDIQYASQAHLDKFDNDVLPEIKKDVEQDYLSQGVEPVLITLGDITWDNSSLYGEYLENVATIPAPLYPVIGNHDHDKELKGDEATAHFYEESFGPTYYGFNLGDDYYIVLDNIIYDTQKAYDVALNQTQRDWLKSYLSYVPAGANVYVCMHSPIMYGYSDSAITGDYKEWIGLFDGYKLSVISGHTHILYNKETLPGIFEHNVGAACGAWWTAPIGKDGAPIGYQVFESKDNSDATWRYKSIGYDDDYQIKLYGPATLKEYPNSVIAYIWGEDAKWSIEGQFGDVEVAPKRVTMTNPDYEAHIADRESVPGFIAPTKSDAYFVFEIPAGSDAKEFKVTATDRFDRKYSATFE